LDKNLFDKIELNESGKNKKAKKDIDKNLELNIILFLKIKNYYIFALIMSLH
jgi:hypothetical protein